MWKAQLYCKLHLYEHIFKTQFQMQRLNNKLKKIFVQSIMVTQHKFTAVDLPHHKITFNQHC